MANTMKASLVVFLIFALLFSQQFASARRFEAQTLKTISQNRDFSLQYDGSMVQVSQSSSDVANIHGSPPWYNFSQYNWSWVPSNPLRRGGPTCKQFMLTALGVAGIGFAAADVGQGLGLCVVGKSAFNAAAGSGALGNTLNFIGWMGIAHSMYELAGYANDIRRWDHLTTKCEKVLGVTSLVLSIANVGVNIAGQFGTPGQGAVVGMASTAVMTAWDTAVEKLRGWCRGDWDGEELDPDEQRELTEAITVTSEPLPEHYYKGNASVLKSHEMRRYLTQQWTVRDVNVQRNLQQPWGAVRTVQNQVAQISPQIYHAHVVYSRQATLVPARPVQSSYYGFPALTSVLTSRPAAPPTPVGVILQPYGGRAYTVGQIVPPQ